MKKTSTFSSNRLALAVAMVCAGASLPALAQVEAKVTGRVHFDVRNNTNAAAKVDDRDSASYADNIELRRARIGVVGTINKDIAYEVVGNAVGSTTNFIDTGWANYGFNKSAQFRAGRFKQPFSLEELTSSNSIDFMERSYGNQMVPGKRLGMMLHGEPMKGLNYGMSVFQNDFAVVTNRGGSNYAARLALNAADFVKMEDSVLHLGVARTGGRSVVSHLTSGGGGTSTTANIVALRSENRGINNVYRARLNGPATTAGYSAPSATSATIDKSMNGLELAYAKGPFKFQMENFDTKYAAFDADSTMDVRVKADYMEVMYNITGEEWAKSYKGGAFSSISPSTVYMKDYGGVVGNGIGAWQVGVRMSKYEASHSNLTGATAPTATTLGNRIHSEKGNTTTYALNWVLNSNARVMLNYAETKFTTPFTPVDTTGDLIDKERIVSLRTQINF